MIKDYEVLKEVKNNVSLLKDLKDEKLVVKKYPKKDNEYSSIYLNEIETLKKLKHPNIVEIKFTKEDEQNYYIAFKHIEGENFVKNFSHLEKERQQYNFIKSTIKILKTLDYIHSHNRIHTDIKPNNIIVDHDHTPFLLDFGTSTITNAMTKSQQELSLWYASPEQKNNGKIDLTTDFYSLGITLIETLVDEKRFDEFKNNSISIDGLIDTINVFDDGVNEEIKNIIRKMTYVAINKRYERAKDIITDINGLLKYFNCYEKFKLHIDPKVKGQLEEEFGKKSWKIEEFIKDKINKEIKYIEYGKDIEGRDEIKLAISDLILYLAIRDEHFYVFRWSRRVPSSVRVNGHIIDDIFTFDDKENSCSDTNDLVDKLEKLNKEKLKKDDENKKKKSFLDKTDHQLKIEREILEKKNISLYALKAENGHKKAKKELIVERFDLQNVEITKEHLKEPNKSEDFIHRLFEDGLIEDPNNQDLLKELNRLIREYFFERHKKDVAKIMAKKYKKEEKIVEERLVNKYKTLEFNLKKKDFNTQLLFDMYDNFLLKQKEEERFFKVNDDVIVVSTEKHSKFEEKFIVKNVNIPKKQITLSYKKEISQIPNELKISFDYDIDNGVLKKQEYSIKDLKNNNTVIENFLSKISNPNTLAPKKEIPQCESFFDKNLDGNQQEAVNKAISLENGEYLVIQGPPGTGKTTVITEIINQILSKNRLAKILVASQSNQAVDNVLEKICEKEEKIVRFGKDEFKLSKIAQKYHEDKVFYKYLNTVKARLENDDTNYFLKNEKLQDLHKDWKKHMQQAGEELKTLLFKNIRVVFGTLVGISSWQDFRAIEFDYVIVDEAGRATLPELMIPLKKAKKFILVGDHKQLPPIVDDEVISKMEENNKKDLETTLFEELYNKIEHKDFKHFLKYNYRSHRSIAKIYSETFYDGEIETKDELEKEHRLDNFSKKVYFYSTSKLENRFDEQENTGKKNNKNCEEIIKILFELEKEAKEKNIEKTVGVITPYLAQRNNIKDKCSNKKGKFTKLTVEINTVDAFQGSDRDIIIYDIVRSQADNKANIEFVADEKRLNVALSRTKELLFIVGDVDFIYDIEVKEKSNPFKNIIKILSKDEENYEIKELKNEK